MVNSTSGKDFFRRRRGPQTLFPLAFGNKRYFSPLRDRPNFFMYTFSLPFLYKYFTMLPINFSFIFPFPFYILLSYSSFHIVPLNEIGWNSSPPWGWGEGVSVYTWTSDLTVSLPQEGSGSKLSQVWVFGSIKMWRIPALQNRYFIC